MQLHSPDIHAHYTVPLITAPYKLISCRLRIKNLLYIRIINIFYVSHSLFYYPERRFLDTQHLDFWKLNQITFEKPDMINFRGLALAYEAGRKSGNVPTMFNAANELAVAMFLDRKIKYLDIYDIIEYAMENIKYIDNPTVEQILETEKTVYEMIESRW